MAYANGTATSYLDLLDKLRLFATTNSALVAASDQWAVERWTGGILPAAFGGEGAWDNPRAPIDLQGAPAAGSAPVAGAKTDTQPASGEPGTSLAGFVVPSFIADYYGRFHFSALRFDLGNITAGVSRVLTMWNAFLVPKVLDLSAQSGTAGVILSGAGADGPVTLKPLKVASTTFSITTDGDPLLRARYVFTIAD